MSILGAFSVSTLAMRSQSTALHMIGTNVSNVQTGGYKRTDVQFQSVLGNQMFSERDQGGVRPTMHQRIDSQGLLVGTTSSLDLAIGGQGFFITSTDFAATDIVYTRDGSFRQAAVNDVVVTDPFSGETFTTKDGYLVDKNGHFLLGFEANADGTFPTTGTPAPMRVDANSFSDTGLPTTAAELIVNLDSNAATVTDHLTAVNDRDTGGQTAEGMEFLTIDFVDSNGNSQSARLNFTKSDLNLWEVSATYQGGGTAQVDTVTLGGTFEAGDLYSVQVGTTTASYLVQSGDTSASVVSGLVAALNADSQIASRATAAAGATPGTITLTAATAGVAFTSAAGATNASSTAQVDTMSVNGAVEAGDVYEYTIGATTATYTVTGAEGSLTDIVNGIVAAINSTAVINSTVNATAGSTPGDIILTARAPGTPFTGTASVTDISGGVTPNTATVTTTTASVAPVADNTASSTTTTANASGLTTTAVTQIPFIGDGRAGTSSSTVVGGVNAPSDISFSFSFPATATDPASTATFDLDVSGLTQFDNPFQLQLYSQDGHENALIQEIGFNDQGHVVGFFSNGNSKELYQIPLAKFANPNALESANGMVFRETGTSGTPTIETVTSSGIASFIPSSIEISNVTLVDEFTNMIRTQQAYNSSANAFRTVDEMLETLIQTKR